jgi:hydroxymethylglutaryl-CoA lyase
MADSVTLFEVGPRDGLQNEGMQIATSDKIALVNLLSVTGLQKIEVSSFVSPKWVPQMADAAEVFAGIERVQGVAYTALTPNMRGLEGAIAADVDEIAIFASASEGFSQKNINCSIAESLERFAPVMDATNEVNIPVRGYVSCVTDCPYDGSVAPAAVALVVKKMMALGCYEVSLGDTIGVGTVEKVALMLAAVLNEVDAGKLAGHFHDTNGQALANIEVALEHGLRVFDASVGGLGGCPYAPGAEGNVATEAVVELVESKGFSTGVDRTRLDAAASFARSLSGDR